MAFVYILKCSDDSYYVGSTTDLTKRIEEHNNGLGANYTKKKLPVKLVYYEECQSIETAFLRERQLHGWSRKKKEALINNMHEKLPELSKRYT
jgi:putative endonuclease